MPILPVRQHIVDRVAATTSMIMDPTESKRWEQIIKVLVGKGELRQEFIVHEYLICKASQFFCNAMKNNWKESQDRVVTLPDDNAGAFSNYLQFIYSGRSELLWPSRISAWGHAKDFREEHITIWANTLVLADKLMDSDTHLAMISRFYDTREHFWDYPILAAQAVNIIYENTPGPCGIRQLLVDAQIYHHKFEYPDDHDGWGQWGGDFADRNKIAAKKTLEITHAASKLIPEEFLVDLFICSATRGPGDEHECHGPPCSALCSPKSHWFHDYKEKYLPKIATDVKTTPDSDKTSPGVWPIFAEANEKAISHCRCCESIG